MHDELPTGFSYVPGSTGGISTDDPSVTGQQLTWNLAPLSITLEPGESAAVTFDAQAAVGEGTYCTEAWAEPGNALTSSGKTAPVEVGFPSSTVCEGAAARVSKQVSPSTLPLETPTVYGYTITIENIGTVGLSLSRVRDLLPPGFLYAPASTGGGLGTGEPMASMHQGRQRLDWDFNPPVQIPPGETRTLSFAANADLPSGRYWNEVWATLDEMADVAYTWPTAPVEVMGVFESTATQGRTTVSSELWAGADSYAVTRWAIER